MHRLCKTRIAVLKEQNKYHCEVVFDSICSLLGYYKAPSTLATTVD